jgi:hypothetical protein
MTQNFKFEEKSIFNDLSNKLLLKYIKFIKFLIINSKC